MRSTTFIALVTIFIHFSTYSSEIHSNQSTVRSYEFTSPVKHDAIIAMYTHPTWRQCFASPIPTDPNKFAADLIAKAKAHIAHFKHHASTNGTVAKKLSDIYDALPAGNSPQKVRKQKYKKDDKPKLEETISAAAAVAQLKKDKTMQEAIDPLVREIRADVQQDPALASPVHRPLSTIFAQQKPVAPQKPALAPAVQKENQENIPPQLALPAPARNIVANAITTVKIGEKRKKSPAPKSKAQPSKTQKSKRSVASKSQPPHLTHEKIEKERDQKSKQWQAAGQDSQKLTSFFSKR